MLGLFEPIDRNFDKKRGANDGDGKGRTTPKSRPTLKRMNALPLSLLRSPASFALSCLVFLAMYSLQRE